MGGDGHDGYVDQLGPNDSGIYIKKAIARSILRNSLLIVLLFSCFPGYFRASAAFTLQ